MRYSDELAAGRYEQLICRRIESLLSVIPGDLVKRESITVAGRGGASDGWLDAAATAQRIQVPVAGRAGIPASARAVVVTLTAVDAESAGYAAVAPCTPNAPSTSTVNFGARATTSNTAVTALGAEGSLCVYASSAADYLVDVVGWLSTS